MALRTEREKMLAGELYDGRDPELMQMYKRARQLMGQFNTPYDATAEERYALLQQLLGATGEGVWIEPPFFCDYGCHIFVGENTFMNFNCVILDCAPVTIGRNVMFGPGVHIYAVTHPLSVDERIRPEFLHPRSNGVERPDLGFCFDYTAPVTIGDNVWIGGGAIVLPGVAIGDGAVIGAGSVVTKDVAAHTLAYGNPCRVVKSLQ